MNVSSPSHIRAISLVLALAVVVGGWLLLEYNETLVAVSEIKPSSPPIEAPSTQPPAPHHSNAAPIRSVSQQRDVAVTFKCQKERRVSFSDQPCPVDAQVLSVTAAEKLPPGDSNRLAKMRVQVAQMEADRLQREQAFAALAATRASAAISDKTIECKNIDAFVADIDSILRQPHDGQTGDYWAAKRKALMDKRFDLRC